LQKGELPKCDFEIYDFLISSAIVGGQGRLRRRCGDSANGRFPHTVEMLAMKYITALAFALVTAMTPMNAGADSGCNGCNVVDSGYFGRSMIGYTAYYERSLGDWVPIQVADVDTYSNRVAFYDGTGRLQWVSASNVYQNIRQRTSGQRCHGWAYSRQHLPPDWPLVHRTTALAQRGALTARTAAFQAALAQASAFDRLRLTPSGSGAMSK
jgi:hypothetical protein